MMDLYYDPFENLEEKKKGRLLTFWEKFSRGSRSRSWFQVEINSACRHLRNLK